MDREEVLKSWEGTLRGKFPNDDIRLKDYICVVVFSRSKKLINVIPSWPDVLTGELSPSFFGEICERIKDALKQKEALESFEYERLKESVDTTKMLLVRYLKKKIKRGRNWLRQVK